MAKFPQLFGDYILDARIGLGGNAEVFRGRKTTKGFEKKVCIKRIHKPYAEDERFLAMFRDEAALVAQFSHQNIVQVFDFGIEDGWPFLVMELIDGGDLEGVLDERQKRGLGLEVADALSIAKDVAFALSYAHGQSKGLVHRDVKPANILLGRTGAVKLADFGVAKSKSSTTKTSTGAVKGTSGYMAPEQVQNHKLDHRCDQFALGVVLWEMLVGKRLFAIDGQPEHMALLNILKGNVEPPSSKRRSLPPHLDEIVLTALALDPAKRYQTMRAFHRALAKALFSHRQDREPDIGALVGKKDSREDLKAQLYSSAPAADDGDKASAYGSMSAIIRTANTDKYAELVDDLETRFPFHSFEDLAQRFQSLRGLRGTRPWDPFALMSSVTGASPQAFADEEPYDAPPEIAQLPKFQIARFLVHTFMFRRPMPVRDDVKNAWAVEDKAAYLSVFRHFNAVQR